MGNNDDDLTTRVTILENNLVEFQKLVDLKIGLITSNIKSERGTMARLHQSWQEDLKTIRKDMRTIERSVWVGIGIIATLQVIMPLVFPRPMQPISFTTPTPATQNAKP